jgi:hypothetical protein
MKTVVFSKRSKETLLHVEAPGCLVNIRRGLSDMQGREVTSVQITADQYAGEDRFTIPELLTPEQVADEIASQFWMFDTMTREQIAEHFRGLAADNRSINVRVVREPRKEGGPREV